MNELDPLRLSRQFGILAERSELSASAIGKGVPGHDPFQGREWPGKTLFQELEELDGSDPLRLPLLRWAHRFVDERVQLGFRVHEGWMLHGERHGVRQPRDGLFSLAELSLFALTTRGAERAAFLDARIRCAEALGAHRRELWARHSEVAHRMGLADPDLFCGAVRADPSAGSATTGFEEQLARQLLDETESAQQQLEVRSFATFVDTLLAGSASEGLPARLAPDTLASLLGDRQWLRGVSLRAFDLPARLSPSSFPIAFERLGYAWAEALAPREFPFVVAHDPWGLRSRTLGVLFGSWWNKAPFLKRRLGVSRAVAASQMRAFSAAFILEARKRAAAVLLRRAALEGGARLAQEAPALSYRLYGQELAGEALLSILPTSLAAPGAFVAFLDSCNLDQALVEAHDEDYFDNPQAIERLRDDMASVPPVARPFKEVQPAIKRLLTVFEQAY